MTTDHDLLARIDTTLSAYIKESGATHDVITCIKALRAVVELHSTKETLEDEVGKKYEVDWCQLCDDYPCPTIQAIEKELG